MEAGFTGWLLSVDFGTSNTAAAHVDEATGLVQTLPLSFNGNLMPSAAYVHSSGQIDVGEVALNQAAADPGGFLPAPKRLLALGRTAFEVGEWTVPAEKVIAAVLRAALGRAQQQHQGRMPDGLVLTHPEGWSGHQVRVLIDAAVEIGCPPHLVRTVSEPQAAAHFYAGQPRAGHVDAGQPDGGQVAPGDRVAVFDFGGGTLDVAVLSAVLDGSFEVTAAQGDNALGGRNFDASIRRWVDSRLSERNSVLMGLLQEDSPSREQRALDESIRQAKEMLSETAQAVIGVYGGSRHEKLLLNRTEFEDLISREVTRAVELAESTFRMAGIDGHDLRAIYLTGGSSRIPLVQQQLRALGPVATPDDPKTVVARGALIAVGRHVAPPAPAPRHSATPPAPFPAPPPEPQPVAATSFETPADTADAPHPDLFAAPAAPPWDFGGEFDRAESDTRTGSDYPDYSTPTPLFPGPPGKNSDPWSGHSGARPLGSRAGRRGLPWRTALAVVGAVVLVGGVVTAALLGSAKHPTPQTSAATIPATVASTTSSSGAVAAPVSTTTISTKCMGEAGAGSTNLPGGQNSPMDVVNALEYAYYVQRSATAVINLYAPNVLNDAAKQNIAAWISQIPSGTVYCVTATPGNDPLTVNYDITENRPGQQNRYQMFLKVTPTAPYAIVALGSLKP